MILKSIAFRFEHKYLYLKAKLGGVSSRKSPMKVFFIA